MKVDLRKKPYSLDEASIEWVEKTIQAMSEKEKIGQLFFHLFEDYTPEYVSSVIKDYHIGGLRYLTDKATVLQDFINHAQKESQIPLFVAANCDAGGNGAVKEGTYIASAAQVEATQNPKAAYDAGYVSGVEAKAIGVNWNFGPNADILFNWRNTIVNTRAYGSDPDAIIRYNREYIKGLNESNILETLKHFPGDGVDERDQHLVMSINDLDTQAWHASFGKVYQRAIDEGLGSIMIGHIALPHIQKEINPSLEDKDILPATLSPEITTTLLKEQLGFNGLVVSDASHMIGLAASMKREDYVPLTIAAGCDMFLFFNNIEEDFNFMLKGYQKGVISESRLHDALRRILGMKAHLSLHTSHNQTKPDDLKVIANKDFLKLQEKYADEAITLVKNVKQELPITPKTHPRIKLYTLYGEEGGAFGFDRSSQGVIIEELKAKGFEVFLHTDVGRYKGKMSDFEKDYDAAFIFADVQGYATENTVRLRWAYSTSNELPWYVHEVPTVFVSLNYTTHLFDVPMVKTYINAYKNSRTAIKQAIEKIMGESEFKGSYNENVFCERWDTKI